MMITLPCGCEVEVTHTRKDRRVECACRRGWVVESHQVIHVTHTIREIKVKGAA